MLNLGHWCRRAPARNVDNWPPDGLAGIPLWGSGLLVYMMSRDHKCDIHSHDFTVCP